MYEKAKFIAKKKRALNLKEQTIRLETELAAMELKERAQSAAVEDLEEDSVALKLGNSVALFSLVTLLYCVVIPFSTPFVTQILRHRHLLPSFSEAGGGGCAREGLQCNGSREELPSQVCGVTWRDVI